jgi:Family of unknown function (DUF6256)
MQRAMSTSDLIRQDLVPMVVGYVLVMGALAIGLRLVRRSAARAGESRSDESRSGESRPGRLELTARVRPGWLRLGVHSLATAVGGYLVLMAVIVLYYYGVAPVAGNFVESAFSGCGVLIGLAAPVFLALSWLADRKGWRL